MKQLKNNLKYVCNEFPDLTRLLVLQARKNEAAGDVGAIEAVSDMLTQIRKSIQWWTSDASRELRRRMREVERAKGERGG